MAENPTPLRIFCRQPIRRVAHVRCWLACGLSFITSSEGLQDDWKLIATGDDGPWELYDLAKDRAEQKNLAGAQPDRVRELAVKWKQVDDQFLRERESAAPSTKTLMPRAAPGG